VKILLVRLRLVGDVVFTTPLIRALRRRFPEAHLSYAVEPAAAPVVNHNPHLNEVIVVPQARGVERLFADVSAAWRVRRQRFDVAIDLHGGPRSAWLTWTSGAPTRIGYAIPGRSWMYTTVVPRAADLAPRHSVVNQWDLLQPLGIAVGDPASDPVEVPQAAGAGMAVDARLNAAGVLSSHALIVIHVSAGNAFRRWPAVAFEDLVVRLAERDDTRRVILTSGPSDANAASRIAHAARERLGSARGGALPDVGEFDLAELRALVARASVYIGGDSGPLHVAAATQTPIVALLGPTLPERSGPWRDPRWFAEMIDLELPCRPCDQRVCVPGDFRCLTWITPDRVIEATERALAAGRA
jgi:lipopolysaccharide heptosyltransferase II